MDGQLRDLKSEAAGRDPVLSEIAPLISTAAARCHSKPFVVGLCGAQGSGKTTLAVRGVPGTHDLRLLEHVISDLRDSGQVEIPAFDKAIDDRASSNHWTSVSAPVDIVVLEGWCVGAVPESSEALKTPLNELERVEDVGGWWRAYVNQQLGGPYQRVFGTLDMLIMLAAPCFEIVRCWRFEQEEALRDRLIQKGRDASALMTSAAIDRFVSYYERVTRHMLAEMPHRADIVVQLDECRRMSLRNTKWPQVVV